MEWTKQQCCVLHFLFRLAGDPQQQLKHKHEQGCFRCLKVCSPTNYAIFSDQWESSSSTGTLFNWMGSILFSQVRFLSLIAVICNNLNIKIQDTFLSFNQKKKLSSWSWIQWHTLNTLIVSVSSTLANSKDAASWSRAPVSPRLSGVVTFVGVFCEQRGSAHCTFEMHSFMIWMCESIFSLRQRSCNSLCRNHAFLSMQLNVLFYCAFFLRVHFFRRVASVTFENTKTLNQLYTVLYCQFICCVKCQDKEKNCCYFNLFNQKRHISFSHLHPDHYNWWKKPRLRKSTTRQKHVPDTTPQPPSKYTLEFTLSFKANAILSFLMTKP